MAICASSSGRSGGWRRSTWHCTSRAPWCRHFVGGARTPREIVTRHACTSCHGFDTPAVGPAFNDVARHYRERGEAANDLTEKIHEGGAS
jgi:cytochrome c551/c552